MSDMIQGDPQTISAIAKQLADAGDKVAKLGNEMQSAFLTAERSRKWADVNQQGVYRQFMEVFNALMEAHRTLMRISMETANHAERYRQLTSPGGGGGQGPGNGPGMGPGRGPGG